MRDGLSLSQLNKRYIRGTQPKAVVVVQTIVVGTLTNAVLKATNLTGAKVYINTKVIKHLYDKRPAEEYDCIIRHLTLIIERPDAIYETKILNGAHSVF